MPAIHSTKLPKHLDFDYSQARTLAEMDEIDGSTELMQDIIDSGVYEPGGRLHGYEPVERISARRERITISMPSHNLIHIKMLANRKEIPYQTYLNSIVKEHLDRELVSKK